LTDLDRAGKAQPSSQWVEVGMVAPAPMATVRPVTSSLPLLAADPLPDESDDLLDHMARLLVLRNRAGALTDLEQVILECCERRL
jgi:hypothetical protein